MTMNFPWLKASIAAAIALILTGALWVAYNEYQRPTIELKKDDWECVKSEQRTHLQPMLVGKITILLPMTSAVCVEYRRRAA